MPAKIIYQTKKPKISIIIPTLEGDEKKLAPLISQIKEQSERALEIILSIAEKPNGHARNVGAKKASGKYLVCIDDDITLVGSRLFERLIRPFKDKTIGMTGASVLVPADTAKLGKDFTETRRFVTPRVRKITDSDCVQHACCVFRAEIYRRLGGESDILITGTDNEMRFRIRRAGWRVVLVPRTLVYHRPPETFSKIKKASFNKGVGAAFALKNAAYIFPYPQIGKWVIKNKVLILFYFVFTLPLRIIIDTLFWRPGQLIFNFYQTMGLIYGYFRYHL